ncbi:RNA polymerase II core subunit [Pelomyxa schiedti]|nr:RNA polymerase II core subunit [Pelomyxa schiedti]
MTTLWECNFRLKQKDPEGRKFDRVSRCIFETDDEAKKIALHMDINVDVYPVEIGALYSIVIAHTLALDGTVETSYDPSADKPSLADRYDYVMYGKIFKWVEDPHGTRVGILASFGGLLMLLQGDAWQFTELQVDAHVYLLMKRTS